MKDYLHTCISLGMGVVVSLCGANVTYAQKPLKYISQALKSTKAVPYVVNPKLPPVVRAQFSTPVVRPHLELSAERTISAQITRANRIARLETTLNLLEEFARTHDHKLPSTYPNEEGSELRNQAVRDIIFLKKYRVLPKEHPLFQRYNQLLEASKPQPVRQVEKGNFQIILPNQTVIDEQFLLSSSYLELFEMFYPDWRANTIRESNITDPVLAARTIQNIESIIRDMLGHYDGYYYGYMKDGMVTLSCGSPRQAWSYNIPLTVIISLKDIIAKHPASLSFAYSAESYYREYQHALNVLAYANMDGIIGMRELEETLIQWNAKGLQELDGYISPLEELVGKYSSRQSDVEQKSARIVKFLKLHGLQDHPLVQRYERAINAIKQQRQAEQEKARRVRAEQREQERQAQAEQQQQERIARAAQQQQEKLARAEQREQERQAQAEQQQQEKLAQTQQREQARQVRAEQQLREEQLISEIRQQEREQELSQWRTVLLQDKTWKNEMQEETVLDPVENARKAAALSEQQLEFSGTVTDEYIDYLLRFYNKLDPLGTGTIQ